MNIKNEENLDNTISFRVASVHGVARSGTSWLGQIINSHPEVIYRYQPLFSYTHKGAINKNSTRKEILNFFNQVYNTRDQFVLQQTGDEYKGQIPNFGLKSYLPILMVMK